MNHEIHQTHERESRNSSPEFFLEFFLRYRFRRLSVSIESTLIQQIPVSFGVIIRQFRRAGMI